MNLRAGIWALSLVVSAPVFIYAQSPSPAPPTSPGDLVGSQKAITTAVPFLAITPDARHAALGDAGVATSPDANSAYWNAAKLVFIDKEYGFAGSYTPWLGKIVNDMSVSYLAGFYKLDKEQTVGISMKYFDLGDIFFTDDGITGTNFNPREFAFDATYSRKLTENFSMGISGRYIYSNLTGSFGASGATDAKPGNSFAADIGAFYTKELKSAKLSNISVGLQISNIGAKLSYTDNANKNFLPTTLRFGVAYYREVDFHNSFTFMLDFSKLMVPSVDQSQSLLSGMFGSFSDAPGGFSEEMHEIMTSIGIEYWYDKTFAARFGYFLEAEDKGNRKYMTIGLGFRKNKFGFDVAYIVPTNQREHPLAETLRFTILLQWPKKSDDTEDSVTDQ